MDFKLASTKEGITALQADIKLSGIPSKIVMEAIDQAFAANKKIITIMNETLSRPRIGKDNLPLIITKDIPLQKRGLLLGPGGIRLKRIQEEFGIEVNFFSTHYY